MALNIVIMAAGKGTRMKSATPRCCIARGAPLLTHVLTSCEPHGRRAHRHHRPRRRAGRGHSGGPGISFVRQMPQLGTGHAIQQVVPALVGEGTTLILNGDVPLIETSTAKALVDACAGAALVLLTVDLFDPTGYNRIIRDPGRRRARHRRAQGRHA